MRTFWKSWAKLALVLLAAITFNVVVHSAMADISPQPSPSPALGIPALDSVASSIENVSGVILSVLAMAFGFLLRWAPTQKPMGLLWLGVGVLKRGVVIMGQLARILQALAEKLDGLLGQNAAQPAPVLEVKNEPPKV